MSLARHIDSYYAASANAQTDHPRLAGDVSCDVCVIGGGITGCSTALHLAERGYEVVLLEAQRIGWGASGRSGGQVIFGYACEMSKLARLVSRADARRLWDFSLAAVDLVKERMQRHAIACDWRPGQMHVAMKPRQREELLAFKHLLEDEYGYAGLEFLEREALQAALASPRYSAGLFDPNSGHLHPLNYTLGLGAAAAAAGVRCYEASPVQRIERGATPRAITAGGRVLARQLVLAGNAYLGALVPEMDRKIMPVGTYIVATEPLAPERAQALIPHDMAVTDINFVLDYFRLSADHRLLFGGRVSYSGLTPPNLGPSMRRRMVQVFPQLADVKIEFAWGGFVDISLNRAPHFGRLGSNIYFAQGFSGHGMALTGLAGQLMAEAIAGEAERFDVFTRIRHRNFPGGRLLRTPALVLAMIYYRLRDWL